MEFAENLILRMMEDPKERDKKFREHLYDLKDKCKKTKEMWSLPVRPYGFWTFERVNSQIFWDAQISQVPGRRDPYDDLLQSAYNPDISATSTSKKWSVRFCCFIHELVCCSVSMILFFCYFLVFCIEHSGGLIILQIFFFCFLPDAFVQENFPLPCYVMFDDYNCYHACACVKLWTLQTG